jgi:hypothetical protein
VVSVGAVNWGMAIARSTAMIRRMITTSKTVNAL